MIAALAPLAGAPSLDARPFGATVGDGGVTFRVWAPKADDAVLVVDGVEHALTDEGDGVRSATVASAGVGSRYGFRLDGGPVFPDPCSRAQPDGVHAPSEVVDPAAYVWQTPEWAGVPHDRFVVYEMHVGTFTDEGTLAAAAERLPHLVETGITAVELMPLHAFPGRWGWGYDPAAFCAVHTAYGTPDDLRRFVDRAHALGLAVVVDVVLNHLGPDGAYVNAFAPMLTAADTPWGDAVNLDGDGSRGVRRFLLDAALVWLAEYRADGLRLDATSALRDASTPHLLAELTAAAAALPGPPRWLVAEDLRNRAIVTRPRADGGYGFDSQWVDDVCFIARRLTGDTAPYYADYAPGVDAHGLASAVQRGWWRRVPEVRHADDPFLPTAPDEGASPLTVTAFLDDHDQSGNRPRGDRFATNAPPDLNRALTALVLLAPQTPMLWMGEEWAARTPFPFFCDHTGAVADGVRDGRARWYADWWDTHDTAALPDPLAATTFESARLDWAEAERPAHAAHRALVRRLLALRRTLDASAPHTCEALTEHALVLRRSGGPGEGIAVVVVLAPGAVTLPDDLATAAPAFTTNDRADGAPVPVVDGGVLHAPGPVTVVWQTA